MNTTTLEHLTGYHILTGYCAGYNHIDGTNEGYFTLDGVTYVATEDPEDGYRSSLRAIRITDYLPSGYIHIPPTKVLCTISDADDPHHLLLISDVRNNHELVMEIGTLEADDYYPCFQFWVNPSGFHFNNLIEGDDINDKWKLLEETNPIFS